jgi:hypothetical protein
MVCSLISQSKRRRQWSSAAVSRLAHSGKSVGHLLLLQVSDAVPHEIVEDARQLVRGGGAAHFVMPRPALARAARFGHNT